MVRCEGEQSSCCCKSYNARFTSFGLNQLSMFDVWPEHRRGLASVKSALIALICMEMDIDWWGQTQVCHWKHFSCTPYSVLSGKMTIDKVKNMILKLKPHNKARAYPVHDFQQLNKKVSGRWGHQNRIRYQTVSYEAEEMWSLRCIRSNTQHKIWSELNEK